MPERPSLELVAAMMRATRSDLELYVRFLQTTLAGALPAELVDVQRTRSVRERLRGEPGQITSVTVTLGDQRFLLRDGAGEIAHVVRGVELGHASLGMDEWVLRLSTALEQRAGADSAAAAALARVTDPGRSLEG